MAGRAPVALVVDEAGQQIVGQVLHLEVADVAPDCLAVEDVTVAADAQPARIRIETHSSSTMLPDPDASLIGAAVEPRAPRDMTLAVFRSMMRWQLPMSVGRADRQRTSALRGRCADRSRSGRPARETGRRRRCTSGSARPSWRCAVSPVCRRADAHCRPLVPWQQFAEAVQQRDTVPDRPLLQQLLEARDDDLGIAAIVRARVGRRCVGHGLSAGVRVGDGRNVLVARLVDESRVGRAVAFALVRD